MDKPKDDRSLEVKVVAAVFLAIASVTVVLRCYVRFFLVKAFGWDDGAMVIALLWYCMFSGCMIGGALYGTGKRFTDLTAHQRVTAMEYWWLCEIAYCWASVACKVSVCIFLLRITVKKLHIWILYCVIALTAIAGLAFMLIMLLQCKPVSFFWTQTALDPSIQGECIDIQIVIAMTYVYSAFAALCDFTVGILPIFMVRKLHMRRQTKIAVIGILSMACIASSAVIIRLPWVKTFADIDFLYATVDIALWSNIEIGLGISAGSLATLRPLLRLLRGSSTTDDYMSPMPGQSASRRLGPSRNRDRPVPLGSLDTDAPGRFRPDKLMTTVTTVHAPDGHTAWRGSSDNSSEERLNGEQPVAGVMEGGIHRTFEVTQTSEAKSASVREHV